jgi:hypothetical protein
MLFTVIAKASHLAREKVGNGISLRQPSVVKMPVNPQDISSFQRVGDDLVVHLRDGNTIRISHFYKIAPTGEHSDLVLQDNHGTPWLAQHSLGATDFQFSQIAATDDLLAVSGAAAGGLSALPVALGAVAAGGAAAAAVGASGGGGSASSGDKTPPGAPTDLAVSADGATVTGRGEAGARVTVSSANGTVLGTDTVGSDGSFHVRIPPQTNGEHLEVGQADPAGNTSPQTEVTAPDTTAPDAPTGLAVSADGTTVTGHGEAGATVTILAPDGTVLGHGTVGADGSFSVAIPAQTNGEHLDATQADAANNISSPAEVTAPDITPPDVSGTALTVSPITGDDVLSLAESHGPVSVSGTLTGAPADAAATVTVSVDGTSYAATVNADGSWTASVPGEALAAATSVTATATFTDAAGNSSAVDAGHSYTVDLTDAPPTPVDYVDDVGSVQSAHSTAVTTDDRTPGLNVAAGLTETVSLYVDGAKVAATYDPTTGTLTPDALLGEGAHSLTYTLTDASGHETAQSGALVVTVDTTGPDVTDTVVTVSPITGDDRLSATEAAGQVTVGGTLAGLPADTATAGAILSVGSRNFAVSVNANGTWSAVVPGSVMATTTAVTATVTFTDAAGNSSTVDASQVYTVDLTVPAAPVIALANDTGASATDGITSDGTVTVAGLEPGAGWQYSTDGGASWQAGTGNRFVLGEGAHAAGTVEVRQLDSAGNVGTPVALGAVTVDTTAPATLTATLAADTGASATDGITGNGALTLQGLDPAATVQYSTDGGATWSGSFTAVEGVNSVQVRQVDAAGNASAPSAQLSFTLDTTAPGVPLAALASDTGASPNDGITDDGTVTVGGLEPGASWEYSIDGGQSWTAGSGTSFMLAEGVHAAGTVEVRQVDAAGNAGTALALGAVTVDTTAPDVSGAAVTVSPVTADNILSLAEIGGQVLLSGRVTGTPADATAAVGVHVGGADYAATVNPDGSWTATVPGGALAADTLVTATATFTDPAGNGATVTASHAYTVDLTPTDAPATPADYVDNVGSVQSAHSTAATTDDTTPGLNVAAGLTGTVNLYVDGTRVAATYDATTGTLTPITPLDQGAHSLTYTLTDATGIETAQSGALILAVDTGVPNVGDTAVTIAPVTGDDLVSAADAAATVTVTGTLTGVPSDATAAVIVTVGGQAFTYAATVNPDGSWTAIVPGNVLAAATSVTATASFTDAAGNSSVVDASHAYAVDITPPVAPGVALAIDTGASATDGISSNGAVTLTGLEPAATWQYSIDGGASWHAGTGTGFVLDPGSYAAGAVEVRQVDEAGNIGAAASLGAVTVDVAAPAAPAVSLAADTGPSATDGITANGAVTVAGLEPGATVQYSTDHGVTWTDSFTAVEGINSVEVRQLDAAGNASGSSGPLTFTLDTTAPAAPAAALVADTGSSATDGITSNGLVAVTGLEPGATWQYSTDGGQNWTAGTGVSFVLANGAYAAGAVEVRQADAAGNPGSPVALGAITVNATPPVVPSVSLTADTGASATDGITSNAALTVGGVDPNATVQYSHDGGVTWSDSFTATEGANTVEVRQVDLAGNASAASAPLSFTFDTTAPVAPAAVLTADTGASGTDGITANGTVTVSGLEPGASWQFSTDGGVNWQAGTGTSFALGEGVHAAGSVEVRQVDAAGNVGAAASLGAVTVDTTAPAVPTVSLTADTGVSATDGITANGAVTVSGAEPGAAVQYSIDGGTTWTDSFTAVQGANSVEVRQVDLAGNISGPSGPLAFTLDATTPLAPQIGLAADTGASATDGVTRVGMVAVSGLEPGTSWQFSTDGGANWQTGAGSGFVLAEGVHAAGTVEVRQVDAAGNVGTPTTLGAVTVDTTAPVVPTVMLATDTGVSASDGITSNGTVTVGGTEPGATAQYSIDGGATWSDSFTAMQGANSVEVRQVDLAGNASAASGPLTFTLDTVAPAAPAAALATDTGASATDGITSNGLVAVSGLEPGATWQFSTDGGTSWQAGTGASFALGEGVHAAGTVEVRQLDAAGNIGAAVTLGAVTVDTAAPGAPTVTLTADTGLSATDGITSNGTLTVGGLEPNATAQYSTDGGATWSASFTAVQGANSVEVRQVDLAGNVSAASGPLAFTLDAVAPAAPVAALAADTGLSATDGITSNGTVAVSGLEAGATWQYSLDSGATWQAGTGTSFALAAGSYAAGALEVRQIDVAGNAGPAGQLGAVTVDITPPDTTGATVTVSPVTGDDIVSLAESRGQVLVGGTVAGIPAGAKAAVTVHVAGTDYAATVNPDGSWTATVSGTALATTTALTATATFTDAAGNSSAVTVSHAYGLDLAAHDAPATPLDYADNVGPVQSTHSIAPATDDTTPGLNVGTGLTQTVSLYVDGAKVSATYDPTTGTLTPVAPLGDGAHSLTYTLTDGTGHETAQSGALVLTIDTTAPDVAGTTVTVSPITGDDILSLSESQGQVLVGGTLGDAPADATAAVSLTVGGQSYAATVHADGSWTATVPGSVLAAATTVTATATFTDAAGNSGSVGATHIYAVDTIAPAAPLVALAADTGVSATDGVTSNGTVTVSGLEPGTRWQFSTDGGATWQAGSGTSFVLGEGVHAAGTVEVRQLDAAGNIGAPAVLGAVTIDTAAPVVPLVALSADTGVSATDGLTGNGALTVTGAEPNATVQYSTDGGTTWSNSLTAAEGANSVEVRQVDLAGNASAASAPLNFTLDTTAPAAPAAALAADTGASATDGITRNGTVAVSGLEPGASWQYSIDGGQHWTAGIGTSFVLGTASYAAGAVQVQQIDAAGNAGAAVSLGAVTVDTVAPVAPTVALTADTGVSATDGITANGALTLTGVEPNATVQYSTDGGATWSNSFAAVQGANSVEVRQVDLAGNVSAASGPLAFTLDTVAPAAPLAGLAVDTGVSATDGITSNGTVTVRGLEAGASWQYSADGGTTWQTGTGTSFVLAEGVHAAGTVEVRQTDAAGNVSTVGVLGAVTVDTTAPNTSGAALAAAAVTADNILSAAEAAGPVTLTGTLTGAPADATAVVSVNVGGTSYAATVNANGSWTATVPGSVLAAAASVTATASFTDVAGNSSAVTAGHAYTVDTVAPVAPLVALAADTGISATDGITSNGTVTVRGLETGATWQYSTNGGQSWTAGTGTSFVLGAGSYAAGAVAVRQADAAGNVGSAAALAAVTVDTTPPAAPAAALAVDTGVSATDRITSNGTVNVSGLEAGASWQYSTDGGASWHAGTGTSFVLGAGSYAAGAVEVRQADVAGNVGAAGLLGTVTVDTSEAAPTTVAISSNGTTVTGLGDPGATVTVLAADGRTVLGSAQVGATGAFSVTIAPQAGGALLGVSQTDLAGNVSAAAQATAPVLFALADDIASPAITLAAPTTQTGVQGSASYLLGISALGLLNLSVLGTPSVTFTVANGHREDAVFTYGALLSVGALSNLHVVVQQLVDGQWQSVSDPSTPYDLLNLSLLGSQAQAGITLEGGTYRAFLAGNTSVADVSLLGTLSVSGTDHDYTVAPTAAAVQATGGVLTNDVAPAGTVVQSVTFHGATTAVNATGTTTIAGSYGTLTIAANGSYTYTPLNNAANIGKAETFQYTVNYGGQTATANLYVEVGSPQANLTWNSAAPGNNASLTGGAVYDLGVAGILNAIHHTSVDQVLTSFTAANTLLLAGVVSSTTTTSFAVEANATAATTLHMQITNATGLGLGLLPTYTIHVTGPGTDYTTSATALLTSGITALDIALPGQLASGAYQVSVTGTETTVGAGTVSFTTQVSMHQDVSHLTQFDAHSVNGDLTANDGQTVPFAGLSVGHGTVLTAVAAAGTQVAGTYGTLTVYADGSYHYQPNAALSYDPANPTPLHDGFDYSLKYPNGATSTAHLDITIDVPGHSYTGTAGADTVHGTGGNDTFTLGAGADTVVYDNLPAGNGHDTWTDFNAAQGDKIDLSSLLTSVSADQSNLPTFLQVHQQSNGAATNTIVSIDPTGTNHFTDLVTLSGVNLTLDQLKDHLVTSHQI